jgi:hypothetical protein
MAGKVKNIICDSKDLIKDLKIQILEFISLNKIICNNLPNLQIPNSLPSLPSLNPSQAVMDLLKDILAVMQGINFDQMKQQLIDWLVEQLKPLEKSIALNLKLGLKDCYACKIAPRIPPWMFQTYPSGGVAPGINIELKKLDLTCLFNINPSGDAGQLLYGNTNDMNRFLWECIQDEGNPQLWVDPVITSKKICYVTYNESPSTLTNITDDGTGGGIQNTDPRPMVFKVQIHNDYQNKPLLTFVNDYINSQNPIFDADAVIPGVIELIFGTLTNKIQLPDDCVERAVSLEMALRDYVDAGIENEEVTMDNSFYEFSSEQMVNIKMEVANRKMGVKAFEKCCNSKTGKVDFDTLLDYHNEIKAVTSSGGAQLNEQIAITTRAMDAMADQASASVSNKDKTFALGEFFSNFITSLQIALVKIFLSPKNLIIIYTMYYLVNGKMIEGINIKKILQSIECILRKILGDLIRKLIYEYLLPLIIKALKDMILCVIIKKLKEKQLYKLLTMISLLPGNIADKIDKINQLMGKGSQITDLVQGFANKINLNSLNNISIGAGKKGKFCD